MMTASQRGFTLIELMIAVAILTVFSATALGLAVRSKQEHAMVSSYQRDLFECRAVLRSIEDHARAAHRVAVVAGGVEFAVGSQRIVYQVENGQLRLRDDKGERVLSRCIESLHVTSRESLVELTLQLRSQRHEAKRRSATVATSVMMRNWEGGE